MVVSRFYFFCFVSTILILFGHFVQPHKILFLLPLASPSHKNVFQPLINGLASRGHEITVVSPILPSKRETRIREIVPGNFSAFSQNFGDPFKRRRETNWGLIFKRMQFIFDACHEVYQHEEFMGLLGEKFHLIFLNAFMNDCILGFIHKLDTPFVLLSTIAAPTFISQNAGNRLPPSFVPTLFLDYSDTMSFFQRILNLVVGLVWELNYGVNYAQQHTQIYRKYLGQQLPNVYEINGKVSMIFMNSHFSLTYPRPTLPDVMEVGGMHCRPAKSLPKDLENFAEGATDGLILFSLGSIVQAKTIPEEVRKIFVNVFSRLKQRVIWKWETGEMSDLPKNVKLSKWLPQQDILGHPNCKLFITHGGLLSTQEATYHGIPLVGLPIFGDQDLNMKKSTKAGYALSLEILDITEDLLEKTILRVLNEKKFSNRAKELSTIFRDQPETPLERAIFWSEYIIRHTGTRHMRSAARDLNFFQYHSLDIIAFLTLIILSGVWMIKIMFVKILKKISKKFFFVKRRQLKIIKTS